MIIVHLVVVLFYNLVCFFCIAQDWGPLFVCSLIILEDYVYVVLILYQYFKKDFMLSNSNFEHVC